MASFNNGSVILINGIALKIKKNLSRDLLNHQILPF